MEVREIKWQGEEWIAPDKKQGKVAAGCDCGNETSGCIKYGVFLG